MDVYEGILQASRQRLSFRKLHRSKSESSVQSKEDSTDTEDPLAEISPGLVSLPSDPSLNTYSGQNIKNSLVKRPASWSPQTKTAKFLLDGEPLDDAGYYHSE